ncbi:MAG: hypothetical protein JO352_28340 [Chloroflexi bacterium]|nr:hypothetical protein [Chloroflexota bacterium]
MEQNEKPGQPSIEARQLPIDLIMCGDNESAMPVEAGPSRTLFFISGFYKVGANNLNDNSQQYSQLANASATETDAGKRKQLYDQMNDLLLDESFTVPVASSPGNVVSRAGVSGFCLAISASEYPSCAAGASRAIDR